MFTFAVEKLKLSRMIEIELYQTVLLVAGILNVMMALALFHNNYVYRNYEVYHRARILTGLCLAVFGIGFVMHYIFQWRTVWPAGATALSVSYFHTGGAMISWSHTSLLNPDYLTRTVLIRDTAIVIVGLISYWTAASCLTLRVFHLSLIVFFLHILWLSFKFYYTYYTVSRRMAEMQLYEQSDGTQLYSLFPYHHSFLLSCHLIIGFGIGSIVFTALIPNSVWPYTLLLTVGIAVFIYIFYSLSEYGTVIDSASSATEEVALSESSPPDEEA